MDKLEYGYTYHIFNRGIDSADLFLSKKDYEHFLELYAKFIHPVADTYAWVLLRNHFHILVRIKGKEEIPFLRPFSSEFRSEADRHHLLDLSGCEAAGRVEVWNTDPDRFCEPCQVVDDRRQSDTTRQFSHLFNGYARYFNTRTDRRGKLFETPFKRIRVDSEKYFRRLVYYIHHNPVKHGFAEHILDWGWSSYLTIISVKPTRMSRKTVLGFLMTPQILNFIISNNTI